MIGKYDMAEEKERKGHQGLLYVVSTPIGNLEDLTFRALRILKEVEFIACEDTRETLKLLSRYGLKKKLISYYYPREYQKIPYILNLLKKGKDVALVSDSGTPGVSDPGFPLIKEAIKEGIKIHPIPGASALTTAIACSGLPTQKFLFLGFPPPKKEATKKLLISLKEEKATLIFYIPARKLLKFIQDVEEILGERQVVIAREMTKIHEEFVRGTPKKLIDELKGKSIKGEITLVIEGQGRKKKQKNSI